MHALLETYLNREDGAASVIEHARLLLRLSRRLEQLAPYGLGGAARVANYKSGRVVIHTDNGAVAAKLRQFSRRLQDGFLAAGLECNGVDIKVQPRQNLEQSRTSQQKPLSPRTCETLLKQSRNLPEGSPLKAALEELLERVARTPG
ncbi:MAG: hypothetical protein RIR00_1246 [Pseudomonadota bacterium]|jgi:hypothetical protein